MDELNLHRKMTLINEKYKKKLDEQQKKIYEESSHASIDQLIAKRITTTTIGTLDAIEKSMGDLWGYGKTDRECSSAQLEKRKLWADLRKKILDHGNNQKRLILDETKQYTVRWNRYQYNIIPVQERKISND